MNRILFTDDWEFRRATTPGTELVRLPHDAMIGETRTPEGGTEGHGGFFPGGRYTYAKSWQVPADADDRHYSLFFEGIQGNARILVNGKEAGYYDSYYREFSVPLTGFTPGENVMIEVDVDNSSVPNSRWYTGSGIYRPVWLESAGTSRIAPDGIAITTTALAGADAHVDVAVVVEGAPQRGARVAVEFRRNGQFVAGNEQALADESAARFSLVIPQAQLWSADAPNLYDVTVTLDGEGECLDELTVRTGLRTIEIDAQRGLRINGEQVVLRGAAVHHDNGILGAATLDAAEFRRARLLKQAGYNAIRSAHNPLSRAFLDACDELGLYVMDELTDVWFGKKTLHDESADFQRRWRQDAASMIAKDRNRPSVIMYSIGNEIAEVGWTKGVDMAREIHEFLRTNDPSRPTTVASNPLLVMMAGKEPAATQPDKPAPERKPATSTAANMMTAKLGKMMVLASLLPAADKATKNVFDVVDIAGYNYAYASYPGARKKYPNRVIVGTESMPGDLPAIWKRVTSVPGVIGDFNWTGWDYLGEVGLGYWSYGNEIGGVSKPYPGILAGSGVFDITGQPAGAMLLLAQAVWGITTNPGIAVRPLDQAGRRANKTPWLSSDAITSWSWGSLRGTAEIEVYSAADHVELFLNGRSLGRKKAGQRKGFVAKYRVPYEPGELTAVSYRSSQETGRSTLRTATAPDLAIRAEEDALTGADGVAHVWIEVADALGTVDATAHDPITVDVTGPAHLAALGSAQPITEESFTDNTHPLYRGRALAILRGTNQPGDVTITVRSERHGTRTLTLHNTPNSAADTAANTARNAAPTAKDLA